MNTTIQDAAERHPLYGSLTLRHRTILRLMGSPSDLLNWTNVPGPFGILVRSLLTGFLLSRLGVN